jgi:hypothetical protein
MKIVDGHNQQVGKVASKRETKTLWSIVMDAAVMLVLLLIFGRCVPMSGDLAQHFLLIDELMKYHGVRTPMPSSMGLMAVYPPGAHWLAAIVGWAAGSGVTGIAVISILSLYVSYRLLLRLLGGNSWGNLLAFLFVYVLVVRANSLVGWELVTNFFYPQMVGDALLLASLLWLSRPTTRLKQSIFILAAGSIVMWVQPLNAVHLFGGGLMLLAYQAVKASLQAKRVAWNEFGVTLVLACATGLILVLHPSMRAMQHIAQRNGYLEFGFQQYSLVLAVCGVIGITTLWRNLLNKNEYLDAVLGTALLASVSLALLQYWLFKVLGDGSVYAVKKHFFIVTTLAVINIARLIANMLQRLEQKLPFAWLFLPVIAGVLSSVALRDFDTPIAPIDAALAYANRSVAASASTLKPGSIVDLDATQPAMINFMITLTAFQYPQYLKAYSWLQGEDPKEGAQFVMVRRSHDVDENCSQRVNETAIYVIVKPSCLSVLYPARPLSFEAKGNGRPYLGKGWNQPESWGVWSVGNQKAAIDFSFPHSVHGPVELTVDARAFVTNKHSHQIVLVEVNNVQVANWTFDGSANEARKTAFIPESLTRSNLVHIGFNAVQAVSPAQVSSSPDTRVLGIGLMSLTIRTIAPPK